MKTKIYLFLLFLTLTFPLTAQNSGPQIEFDSTIIDYGIVENSSDGKRVFTFVNNGDKALIIKKVASSCGCTIPKKPEAPIAPGERGEIVVEYDTKNRKGPFRKTITVTTNITENPIVALKIKGEVLPKS